MESLGLEKENVIIDIKNIFRLRKESKAIKDRILRDIKNFLSIKKKIITKSKSK